MNFLQVLLPQTRPTTNHMSSPCFVPLSIDSYHRIVDFARVEYINKPLKSLEHWQEVASDHMRSVMKGGLNHFLQWVYVKSIDDNSWAKSMPNELSMCIARTFWDNELCVGIGIVDQQRGYSGKIMYREQVLDTDEYEILMVMQWPVSSYSLANPNTPRNGNHLAEKLPERNTLEPNKVPPNVKTVVIVEKSITRSREIWRSAAKVLTEFMMNITDRQGQFDIYFENGQRGVDVQTTKEMLALFESVKPKYELEKWYEDRTDRFVTSVKKNVFGETQHERCTMQGHPGLGILDEVQQLYKGWSCPVRFLRIGRDKIWTKTTSRQHAGKQGFRTLKKPGGFKPISIDPNSPSFEESLMKTLTKFQDPQRNAMQNPTSTSSGMRKSR